MIQTRHEFLAALHELVQPRRYLEIGVQFGHSLRLTAPTCAAIGVDPDPLCAPPPNARLMTMTSDEYFLHTITTTNPHPPVDMAFIDGMHLIEYALRDFINCESIAAPGGIIVLDDVLPYSADIAGRVPLPGDWAGDVWKLWPILTKWRPNLRVTMVEVEPTGVMVVQGLDPDEGPQLLRAYYDQIVEVWRETPTAVDETQETPQARGPILLGHHHGHSPEVALRLIAEIMEGEL